MAAAHNQDIRDIMRQELSMVGSTGEGDGEFDIRITGPVTFEASDNVPAEAIEAAVHRIFDRIVQQASNGVLAEPDQ